MKPITFIVAPLLAIAWLWIVCVWAAAFDKYRETRDGVWVFSAVVLTVFVSSISYGAYLFLS
jgi:hypothetical protein